MAPTLEGGLRIDAESLHDWMVLELICADAARLPGGPLYDSLSSRMTKDDDWKEFVMPDIVTQFDEQITFVSRAISSAPREDDHSGSLFITKENAMTWYGTVNQARLSLEKQFNISIIDDLETEDDLTKIDQETQAAIFRNQFYSSIQSLLLEYVL